MRHQRQASDCNKKMTGEKIILLGRHTGAIYPPSAWLWLPDNSLMDGWRVIEV
jgi:hypothetical protein